MLRWIKGAMIVSFLKQVLKLFWDNCELVVFNHLLEKFNTFFANVCRGRLFFYFQLTVEGWVFMSADFWILESNDNINTFLTSYQTLFLHILWRDSHSWLMTPRIYLSIYSMRSRRALQGCHIPIYQSSSIYGPFKFK